jgi:hypothetical protein
MKRSRQLDYAPGFRDHCHVAGPCTRKKEPRVPVKQLVEFVNAVLRASGEIKEYNALEIGRLLSRLNVPRSRTAGRMVIDLTRQVRRRVHDLKRRYGVTTSPDRFPGCPDCEPSEVPGNRPLM